jgi:hypothetical protein
LDTGGGYRRVEAAMIRDHFISLTKDSSCTGDLTHGRNDDA